MRYTLTQDSVVYIKPGRSGVRLDCLQGRLWLTIEADCRDYVLARGDGMHLRHGARVAVMAFADARLALGGRRFQLIELMAGKGPLRVRKISVRQPDAFFSPRIFTGELSASAS